MPDYNILIFEKYALEYDRWFETHTYAYESEISAVRSLLPRGGKGLEVGVGTGRFASQVGIKVGVEPAHAVASIARQRGIQVYEARAEVLPFDNETFDFVVMVTTLCFLNDPVQAIREAKRVLIRGGRIVIGMIDKDSPVGKSYEAKKGETTFYRHTHFYSVTQVIDWLIQSEFGAIKTCQTIFKLPKDMTAIEHVKDGYGEGGFVVIAAQKEVKT